MRVGLDAHMVGGQETGNETYVKGLVEGFQAGTFDVDLLVYQVGRPWTHAAPRIELCGALLPGARAVVGDVVDQPAELVDGEHRLALGLGHDAHGRVERAARDLRLQGCVVRLGRHPSQPIATLKAPRKETPAASTGR